MSSQLSERAKQLIPKARIVSFANWQGLYTDEVLQIFQQADDEGRYLTDEDLAPNSSNFP
jgi:allophycocyanin-B